MSHVDFYIPVSKRTTRGAPAEAAPAPASETAVADKEWSASDDDEADDEATVDADERAAAAQGLNLKVIPR